MIREVLPNRRSNEAFDITFQELTYTIHVGRFADGRLAEVFIYCILNAKGQNMNTTHQAAVARDAAVILSVALQHGTPLDVLRGAVTQLDNGGPASIIGCVLLDHLT